LAKSDRLLARTEADTLAMPEIDAQLVLADIYADVALLLPEDDGS
jgi:hypothetical protein